MKYFVNVIKKIKDFWNDKSSNYMHECLNCGKKFDGIRVEYFIKHQLDYKHWDSRKYKKEQSTEKVE